MTGRLEREIKQNRPFRSVQAEAYLNLLKTADVLSQSVGAALKVHGLSETQYNVLRILRGAEPDGLACREIGCRLIAHDPDITRLLDRLENRGLVVRNREKDDRRVIVTRITTEGLELIAALDEPMDRLLQRIMGNLGIRELRSLIELLELARAR